MSLVVDKPSKESNFKLIQFNESGILKNMNAHSNKVLVKIIPKLEPPRKIKYMYSELSTRKSQTPNYAYKDDIIKIKTNEHAISDIFISNVPDFDDTMKPRNFDEVIEKNVLNMPPIIYKDFDPKIVRTFEKVNKNNDLNFIQTKSIVKKIEHPIPMVVQDRIILKRL
jgi:hypothetical protein